MRDDPESVHDPQREVLERVPALPRNAIEIRRIRHPVNAEPERIDVPLPDHEWEQRNRTSLAINLDRVTGMQSVELGDRRIVAAGSGVEAIAEPAGQERTRD